MLFICACAYILVCVCVREREGGRERGSELICVQMKVCVCELERMCLQMKVCVCLRVCEGDRENVRVRK